jgi:hypothetical protein
MIKVVDTLLIHLNELSEQKYKVYYMKRLKRSYESAKIHLLKKLLQSYFLEALSDLTL